MASHRSFVTEAGWRQAIQIDISRVFVIPAVPYVFLGNSSALLNHGGRGLWLQQIFSHLWQKLWDVISALRNWKEEQLSPEISQPPELDFAASFWACFSVWERLCLDLWCRPRKFANLSGWSPETEGRTLQIAFLGWPLLLVMLITSSDFDKQVCFWLCGPFRD